MLIDGFPVLSRWKYVNYYRQNLLNLRKTKRLTANAHPRLKPGYLSKRSIRRVLTPRADHQHETPPGDIKRPRAKTFPRIVVVGEKSILGSSARAARRLLAELARDTCGKRRRAPCFRIMVESCLEHSRASAATASCTCHPRARQRLACLRGRISKLEGYWQESGLAGFWGCGSRLIFGIRIHYLFWE